MSKVIIVSDDSSEKDTYYTDHIAEEFNKILSNETINEVAAILLSQPTVDGRMYSD